MSEQNQSNVQAFGAGLLGFVAVLAIGGGALMVRSSQQAKEAARPAAAAAPIDLGASAPRPSLSPAPVQNERRAESPAPLIGAESEPEASEASTETSVAAAAAAAAAAASPESAPSVKSQPSRLEATRHLDVQGNGTSATAVVENTLAPVKDAKAVPNKKVKLEPSGAGATSVASVHYGVTDRSQLMGRAAGPVYNFKGGAKVAGSGQKGQMADEVNARILDLQRQLEASGLPADQRAKLQKELEDATKGAGKAVKAAQ